MDWIATLRIGRVSGSAFKASAGAALPLLLVGAMAGRSSAEPPPADASPHVSAPLAADFTTKIISLSYKGAGMSAIIADLAKQSERSILVNDEPRDNQADVEFKGSLKDALDAIGKAYDYAWRLNKRGVVLMTKRFSRQEEYPPLNAREMNQTVQDTIAILDSFPYDFRRDWNVGALICDVYASLSPQQIATLRGGGTISGAQLSGAQRQLAQNAVLGDLLIGPRNHIDMIAPQLRMLASATSASYATLRYEDKTPLQTFQPSEGEAERAATVRYWYEFDYVGVDKLGTARSLPILCEIFSTAKERAARDRAYTRVASPVLPDTREAGALPQESAVIPPTHSVDSAPTQSRLQVPAHLELGAVTVDAVIQFLSAQTGLPIQAEDYIRERALIVQMNNITVQAALDTLTELNDWRWFRREDGVIQITRKRPRIPQTPAELPACLRAALPADYRIFLGAGVATQDLPQLFFMQEDGSSQAVPSSGLEASQRTQRLSWRLGNLQRPRLLKLRRALLSELGDMQRVRLEKGETLTWKRLPPKQRKNIEEALMLTYLSDLGDGYLRLLANGLSPFQNDINTAQLRIMQGNDMAIGSQENTNYTFIGTAIPGLKSTFPKLPMPKDLDAP